MLGILISHFNLDHFGIYVTERGKNNTTQHNTADNSIRNELTLTLTRVVRGKKIPSIKKDNSKVAAKFERNKLV